MNLKTKAASMMCAGVLSVTALMAGAQTHAKHAGAAMTDDDKKFLSTAAQSDVNEIKMSELAEQKATNPAVKAFARKMITEHKELSAKMKPFAEEAGLQAPGDMDDSHKDDFKKLSDKSGADFDKQYMDDMVSDHSKALDAFTSEAKDTKNARLRATVLKGKTAVAAHKNMAYDLKKKL